ncbi:protein-L-isoaspartate(D-aspartate) O-methyltransferase [Salinibacterium sp. SYSU T00001]|uniref:protein-L-isoaspartate(D-aspartate) O-methyltransferase n=1 Tax=Homoserinimonas sedimenticola TaxID=2986805 RepID=UPI002235E484|nr:protein-L-isoaspartate(D-aspartate) O-methyltransferase [Salinibacterium sedimenticola]MCW4384639.1 protein-L-isoaspartate(D-aspartate) O-methyltransferase [Salinibacterium sedimenticola]
MNDLTLARQTMLNHHLLDRGIEDERVLAAMERVPREEFVAEQARDHAYDDRPLPIEEGQTISQPYIVAFMAQAAAVREGDRVLEIGAGSGYGAAVLGQLAARVDTIERIESLAASAAKRMSRLDYDNVRVHAADGTRGLRELAPFDAIIVTAAGPAVPDALREQLAIGGRLVIPVERRYGHQQLVLVTREDDGSFTERDLLGVAFVPLVGEHGYRGATRSE